MYLKHHNGQLTIEEFHVPFGGTLDPDNRWVLFSTLMPWEELEETYAPQFSPTTGAPAKSVRLAFGALFIKQRLGLTDEETVEQDPRKRISACATRHRFFMNYVATVSRMGVWLWPPDACLQGLASNYPMLLRPNAVVVSDGEKADLIRQVSDEKVSASEPLMTHRNAF